MHDRLGDWRRLVDSSGRKPTRKRVHALRVITLRVQAEMDLYLAELPRASHQAQAILEFGRQGDRLRKVLGPVRELDVWIGKMQGLRETLAESTGYLPKSTLACVRQIERLESRLKEQRKQSEKKLVSAISKRKDDFIEAAEEIDRTVHLHAHETDASAEKVIRMRFADVAKDFRSFDEENLHDFRKRIKMVRYLAEIHSSDAACAQIAAQMKKLQSVIGEWHDWQVLEQDVRERRHMKDLAELLETIAAESLQTALTTCDTITQKLIGEYSASTDGVHLPARKPPVHDGFLETRVQKLA
jgi:CHAD domain-containing protein